MFDANQQQPHPVRLPWTGIANKWVVGISSQEWRRKKGIDTILEQPQPAFDYAKGMYEHGVPCFTKSGQPVWVDKISDMKKSFANFKVRAVVAAPCRSSRQYLSCLQQRIKSCERDHVLGGRSHPCTVNNLSAVRFAKCALETVFCMSQASEWSSEDLYRHAAFCEEWLFRRCAPEPFPLGRRLEVVDLKGMRFTDIGSGWFSWWASHYVTFVSSARSALVWRVQ